MKRQKSGSLPNSFQLKYLVGVAIIFSLGYILGTAHKPSTPSTVTPEQNEKDYKNNNIVIEEPNNNHPVETPKPQPPPQKYVIPEFTPVTFPEFPPRHMPRELKAQYTLNGIVEVEDGYYVDFDPWNRTKPSYTYTKEAVELLITKAKNRETYYYGVLDAYVYQALDWFGGLQGKSVVVMGSTNPWYEAIALQYGCKDVTIIEYNRIESGHPHIKMMLLEEYLRNPIKFDVAFSFSSFEHDGLGRYGDPLNPYGDLRAMEKMKNFVKPGGYLFLGVPTGKDMVVWNAHRIYGRIRYPLLLQHWTVIKTFGLDIARIDIKAGGDYHPVFVLENKEPAEPFSFDTLKIAVR